MVTGTDLIDNRKIENYYNRGISNIILAEPDLNLLWGIWPVNIVQVYASGIRNKSFIIIYNRFISSINLAEPNLNLL